jgi:hypothetical protein
MPSNEADIRNAALEEAIDAVKRCADPSTFVMTGPGGILRQATAAIRALKSDPAPVPEPKPFTFADPAAQREWERQRKERADK